MTTEVQAKSSDAGYQDGGVRAVEWYALSHPFTYAFLTIVIVASIGAFFLATMRAGSGLDGDGALYVLHARNIVQGLPYADTGYIYNPARPIHPRSYPPMLPLLLVPIYALSGLNFYQMQMVMVGSFILFLPILAAISRQFLPPAIALGVTALVGFHPALWDFKEKILSDLPFFFFCYAGLYLADRLPEMGKSHPRLATAGAAIALGCACLTRTIGVILLPIVFLSSWFQWKRFANPGTFVVAVAGLIVILASLVFPSGIAAYAEPLRGHNVSLVEVVRAAVGKSVMIYGSTLQDLVVQHVHVNHWLTPIWAGGCFLIMLLGWLARVRTHLSLYELFFVAYALFFVIYPIPDIRYSMPLWPLFFVYLFYGAWLAGSLVGKAAQRGAAVVLLGIFFVLCLAHYVDLPGTWLPGGLRHAKMDFGPIPYETDPAGQELFSAINTRLPRDAVLLARKPTYVALFTGRRAAVWPEDFSDGALWAYIRSIGASYIVENVFTPDFAGPDREKIHAFIRRNQSDLRLVFSNRWFNLYEIF